MVPDRPSGRVARLASGVGGSYLPTSAEYRPGRHPSVRRNEQSVIPRTNRSRAVPRRQPGSARSHTVRNLPHVFAGQTRQAVPQTLQGLVRRVNRAYSLGKSAGGCRTHLKPLCRRLPCRLAPAPRSPVSSPGVEPSLRPSRGRVQLPHTPRTCFRSVPRRGIEPRPAVSRTAMPSGTPAGRILSVSTRTRTWIRTFGGSYAILCTIETFPNSIPTWS